MADPIEDVDPVLAALWLTPLDELKELRDSLFRDRTVANLKLTAASEIIAARERGYASRRDEGGESR